MDYQKASFAQLKAKTLQAIKKGDKSELSKIKQEAQRRHALMLAQGLTDPNLIKAGERLNQIKKF